MSTLVCFHAHPDDEVITTGGLICKARKAGHRVVLVTATRGEQGEVQPGSLLEGEDLRHRRVAELRESAEILGAEPPIFLEYEDSGMMGEASNNNPSCFWQADVEQVANALAIILQSVEADVVTIYDDHGLYGHPDHIQVHRVGLRATEIAGIPHVYEATSNRTRALEGMAAMRAQREADGLPLDELPDPEEFKDFGVAEKDLAYLLSVTDFVSQKQAALRAHKTQVSEQSFFLDMEDEQFAAMFGSEVFAIPGSSDTGGPELVELLPGL